MSQTKYINHFVVIKPGTTKTLKYLCFWPETYCDLDDNLGYVVAEHKSYFMTGDTCWEIRHGHGETVVVPVQCLTWFNEGEVMDTLIKDMKV